MPRLSEGAVAMQQIVSGAFVVSPSIWLRLSQRPYHFHVDNTCQPLVAGSDLPV